MGHYAGLEGLELHPISRQKVHDHNRIGHDECRWHQPTRSVPDPCRQFALLITISDMHRSYLNHGDKSEDVARQKKSIGESEIWHMRQG